MADDDEVDMNLFFSHCERLRTGCKGEAEGYVKMIEDTSTIYRAKSSKVGDFYGPLT